MFDFCRLAQIGNKVRLAWTRASFHWDPDSNWPFFFSCILSSFSSSPTTTVLTWPWQVLLTKPITVSITLYLSLLFQRLFLISSPGSKWSACHLPPDCITSLSVLCILVLLISLGGTIMFLFIRKTEQMCAMESNGGTTGSWRTKTVAYFSRSTTMAESLFPYQKVLTMTDISLPV